MNLPATANGEAAGRPVKVLVIDDEEAIRRNLASGLEDLGYTVTVAADGGEGIERFHGDAPDIIMADLSMPGIGGLEVINVVRGSSPLTPVVIVSGSGTLHDAVQAIRLGAWDYVIKPVANTEELDLILRRNLSRAALLRENQRQKKQLEILLAENTEKLRESESRLRYLSDNLPDSAVYQLALETDGTVRFLHWSAGIERLNGLSVDAVLQDYSLFFNQIVEEDRHLVVQAREASVKSLAVFNVNVRFRRADGELRWMNLNSAPLRLPDGRMIWNGIETDITERKLAEVALIQSEARFSRMFRNCPVPTSLIRVSDGVFLDTNDAFLRMSEYTREEVIGRTSLDLQLYVDLAQRTEVYRQLLQYGRLHGFHLRFRTKSGHVRHHLLWADVISIGGENCSLAIALDVTEQKQSETQQKQLEEQLRQAQKLEAMGTLAGGIAHDFNNILFAIIAYTELSKMNNPGNADLQENLGAVLEACKRATTLVRQILTFSRRQKSERKVLQVGPVVAEALKLLRATLPATISIEHSVEPDLPDILGDPTQIHQVVVNLCTNAAHAMRGKQGRLAIQLGRQRFEDGLPLPDAELHAGTYVRLAVSDSGHGMDEPTLKRIFEPFFTTKGPGEGTGLGLSVVHGIVKEHKGAITAVSSPGCGATFTIFLPVHEAASQTPVVINSDAPRGSGQRILFVDDEQVIGEAARRIMSRLGYQPLVFTQPEIAWNLFQKNPRTCDLVITDLTMPGLTGLDLAARVLSLRPNLPVIIITGGGVMLGAAEIKAAGIRDVLSKPLDYAVMAQIIHQALQKPEA